MNEASQLANALTRYAPDSHVFETRIIGPDYRRQMFHSFATIRENPPEFWDREVFPREHDGRADVYFSVATRTERAGGADAVGVGLAAWADMDDEDAQYAFPIPPSAVVQTSPPSRKFHGYWFLSQPTTDLSLLLRINRGIPNADHNAIDKARVLRAPGFINLKYDSRPRSKLRRLEPDCRYSLDELAQAFPPTAPEPKQVARVYSGTSPSWVALVFDAIVDFLERGGFRPRQRGGEGAVMALCPLHSDTNESLSMHPVKGWKCHGCGAAGKLTELAHRLNVQVTS